MSRRIACLAAMLALAAPAGTRAETSATGPYAASLLQFINAYRAQHGLAPLAPEPGLVAMAREHSRRMAEQGALGHEGFEERFERSGSTACVENVGWNHPDARSQFLGWRASPPHDAALRHPGIRRCGIAVVDAYVTFLACR